MTETHSKHGRLKLVEIEDLGVQSGTSRRRRSESED